MSFINWGSESPEQLKIRKMLEEQALFEQAAYYAAIAAAAAGSGGLKKAPTIVYLRALDSAGYGGNTDPWDSPNYVDDLNAVFGENGWTLALFETANLESVFSQGTAYVYIDGSDCGAEELKTFLDLNHGIIETWVEAGGNLFLNSAPNEGGDIDFYFGGVQLLDGFNSSGVVIAGGEESHPIFNGPGEVGTNWTGWSFAHAKLKELEGLAPLIVGDGDGDIVCAEMTWGEGKAVFGTMTSTEFHDPQPEASYLKQNIHSYLSGKGYTPQLGLRVMSSGTDKKRSSRR